MAADVFYLLQRALGQALSVFDDIFDSTGMWPIYLGAFAIIAILRFIVLPMLMSSTGAEKSAGKKSGSGGSKSDG